MEHEGAVVAAWFTERHYGFVKLGDGREIFCHEKVARRAGLDRLRLGERIDVDLAKAPDGRLQVERLIPSQLRARKTA